MSDKPDDLTGKMVELLKELWTLGEDYVDSPMGYKEYATKAIALVPTLQPVSEESLREFRGKVRRMIGGEGTTNYISQEIADLARETFGVPSGESAAKVDDEDQLTQIGDKITEEFFRWDRELRNKTGPGYTMTPVDKSKAILDIVKPLVERDMIAVLGKKIHGYQDRIKELEDSLRERHPTAEQIAEAVVARLHEPAVTQKDYNFMTRQLAEFQAENAKLKEQIRIQAMNTVAQDGERVKEGNEAGRLITQLRAEVREVCEVSERRRKELQNERDKNELLRKQAREFEDALEAERAALEECQSANNAKLAEIHELQSKLAIADGALAGCREAREHAESERDLSEAARLEVARELVVVQEELRIAKILKAEQGHEGKYETWWFRLCRSGTGQPYVSNLHAQPYSSESDANWCNTEANFIGAFPIRIPIKPANERAEVVEVFKAFRAIQGPGNENFSQMQKAVQWALDFIEKGGDEPL